jgi:quinol-cytochrome oxidoreductase complex cytochrome b subunit
VPLPAAPQTLDWHLGLTAAAVGGLASALASLVPIVSLGCCLWMLGGGALAVSFYHRRSRADVTSGMGARLGAASGVLGFFIFAALTAIRLFVEVVVLHMGGRIRSELRQALEQSAARNPDPQVQAMVQWMMSPQGFATFVTVGMLLFFIAFVVFCTAGGALGASLFGKRARDYPPQPCFPSGHRPRGSSCPLCQPSRMMLHRSHFPRAPTSETRIREFATPAPPAATA